MNFNDDIFIQYSVDHLHCCPMDYECEPKHGRCKKKHLTNNGIPCPDGLSLKKNLFYLIKTKKRMNIVDFFKSNYLRQFMSRWFVKIVFLDEINELFDEFR